MCECLVVGQSSSHVESLSLLFLLLRGLQNGLNTLELLLPCSDLHLDLPPLLLFQLSQHVTLNHDLFVKLINFGVNNFVLDRFNRPELYFILIDVEELGKLLVFEV